MMTRPPRQAAKKESVEPSRTGYYPAIHMTGAHPKARESVALFGGSFDPIHSGHLAVARAALKRFGLDRIYLFLPACPRTNSAAGWRHFRIAWRWWHWPARITANSCRRSLKPEKIWAGINLLLGRHRATFPAPFARSRASLLHYGRGPVPGNLHVEGLRNAAGFVRFHRGEPARDFRLRRCAW